MARDAAAASGARAPPQVTIAARNWFNPNLTYRWFLVPNLIALIALLIGLLVTALSVARERELGTFDQLMVSPLRVHEVLLGKVLPPILIGLFHITLYVLAAIFVFHVPLRGPLPMLYVAGLVYLAAVAGVGLFISSLSMTQQQAILGAFPVPGAGDAAVRLRHADREHADLAAAGDGGQSAALFPRRGARRVPARHVDQRNPLPDAAAGPRSRR